MSDVYEEDPPLTAQQQMVVEQPADAKVLVTAGAGAGKTYTLIRRLDVLIDQEYLGSGDVLVLTFSRAAVRELQSRFARHGRSARHVRAQTFDSWALALLMDVDAAGEWQNRSFDARIQGAREAIEEGLLEEFYGLDVPQHVVIDEVQDLVGDRRELVEALLDRLDCGFTVVGDPAQSIYGFTVRDAAQRADETNQFFVWLRNSFAEDLVELTLDENFRARTEDARLALAYGQGLRSVAESDNRPAADSYEELRSALRSSLNFGELDDFVCKSLAAYEGTTAILCRTNGQALLISEQLYRFGVEHSLQRSVRDRVVGAWLARLFQAVDGSVLTRTRFDELAADLPLPSDLPIGELWRLLLRGASAQGGSASLDLGRLRAALAVGRLPDELTAQRPARIVVSSFHRAKGLEFDRVVVVDPGPPIAQESRGTEEAQARGGGKRRAPREVDLAEEARLLYVAMTRPRDELYWLNPVDTSFVRRDPATDRWARFSWRRWARRGVEVAGGDVHADHPAGTMAFSADPKELQHYLAQRVRPGDEIVLVRTQAQPNGLQESPPYVLMHADRPIGVVSERFRSDLFRLLKLSANWEMRNWPRTIESVRVDVIETAAGSTASGQRSGLGPHGVWLAPRLIGLSTFTWDGKTEEAEAGKHEGRDSGVSAQ